MERQRRKKKSSLPGFLSPRSENLLTSPKDESTVIINKQRYKIKEDQSDGGRHSTVMFASKTPDSNDRRKEFAIKKQLIKSPVNLADRAYREVFILQQLNKLKENREFYPSGVTNFVDLVEWFKGLPLFPICPLQQILSPLEFLILSYFAHAWLRIRAPRYLNSSVNLGRSTLSLPLEFSR
jgi:hypothetical protein